MSLSNFNDPPLPFAWSITVEPNSTFGGANLITVPGIAQAFVLQTTGSNDVQCQLNGEATFNISHTIGGFNFNKGDMLVTSFDFQLVSSGASAVNVEIIAGVVQG